MLFGFSCKLRNNTCTAIHIIVGRIFHQREEGSQLR